jgi:hypothetical protein
LPVSTSVNSLTLVRSALAAYAALRCASRPKPERPCYVAERDQCGAMASSCGFTSRKTTRPFFM